MFTLMLAVTCLWAAVVNGIGMIGLIGKPNCCAMSARSSLQAAPESINIMIGVEAIEPINRIGRLILHPGMENNSNMWQRRSIEVSSSVLQSWNLV